MDTFPPMEDQLDAKEMQQLCLLGDPSLKIGGYTSTQNIRAGINGDTNGIPDKPIAFEAYAIPGDVQDYTFTWDLDEDGQYDDATGETTSWTWSDPGDYTIGLKVTDNSTDTDTDTASVQIVQENPTLGESWVIDSNGNILYNLKYGVGKINEQIKN